MKKIVSDKTRQASQRPGKGSTFGPHKTIQNEAPKILTPEKKDANRKKKCIKRKQTGACNYRIIHL